jgi:Tol biopolymer transport system component
MGGWEPSWSPDGTRIAFRSFRDGPSELYVMNADGTGVAKLVVNSMVGTDDAYPFWGPSGGLPSPD